ncbi:SDR family NAD(P)-dependent oxidoreductase [Solwaraspora sp. WMMD792]|uniref:SDR family NAD(P)-dependent oxidoreductase n=1 Tax=Solwaraspora sp. WMMD792 TaxID=3016099 RepID=UPI0024174CAA|nr:SDR family NAD(P)-dependent oxidoreductase [Solwaraspora sp. WMMD792]MDG4771766.1 SDR family NAD(P)-dependent oxidoreductase [Solwaraspora sp. WMMD792]
MTSDVQRVAVVTGANRGLGRAIAQQLAQAGLHVVVTARSDEAAERTATELTGLGLPASGHQLDITDPASVARAMADVGYQYGRLDVLVNNAAIAIDRGQAASAADMEKVAATLDANLIGTWRCCTAAIPEMKRNGYGRIVNVTSHMGTSAEMGTGSVSYRVSKAGVNAFTQILAAELHEHNILVNAASPGKVDTRLAYGKANHTPGEAADTFTWLATLPDDGPTGDLFYNRKLLPW